MDWDCELWTLDSRPLAAEAIVSVRPETADGKVSPGKSVT